MKRILLFASALAGLFVAASCQQEIVDPEVKSGVTYEITLPAGPQTRGEDGYATYDLHYEVYKTVDATALETAPLLFEETVIMTGNTTKLTLDLLNDQDYTVLFWANQQGMDYFDLTDLRQVGVKQVASNNDDRDAFCGMDQLAQHDGAQSKTVELKRPFAQINIATLVNAVDYDINPVSSLVKVKDIPVGYNVFTGEPVGAEGEVEYTVNTVPVGNLTVNGTDYKKVAMNYALVPATENNSATVEVYYEINTANGTVKNSIPNVPVKKNYRTNIIGNLLTSNATYTIELKAGFEEGDFYGPEFVKTPVYDEATKTWTITCRDELLYVAQQVNTGANSFLGQTVKVVNDIDLKNIPWTPIGSSTTVTFRGMFEGAAVTKSATEYPTISNLKIENGSCSGFFGLMCNGGKVRNINFNNVTISGERQLGTVVGQVYGNLEQPTIENVTVDNAVITAVPVLDGAVYDNGDKVGGIAGLIGQNAYIKGCTVKNSTFTGYRDMGGIVGCTQNGHPCNLTGNHSENIDFVVTSQYVPYSGNTPHGATGAIRGGTRSNAGDVIEGNTSSEGTISEVVLVNDQVSLQNAINAAGVGVTQIKFAEGITGNVVVIQKPGVKINIDGDHKKYNGFIKVHSNSNHYADAALTIKNVNFETSTVYYDSDNEPYFNFIEALENGSERYSTNITVDGCTFTATGDAVNEAVALQIKASKNAKALNCTATGLHSLVQAQSCDETVVVNGCTVNGKNGVAFKQVKAATVEGTTITATGYGIRFDGNTDNYGITVKDINVNAVQPLIVRKMTGANNTIALEGTNTLTTEAEYQIVITKDSDDQPYVKPTGTYELTGADNYTVFPAPTPVDTWEEFTNALNANETEIKLTADITYDKSFDLKKNVTIDLNGKSLEISNPALMLNIFSTATIKNGSIKGKVYARTGSNITFDGVTFGGSINGDGSTEGLLQVQGACNVYANNCSFDATNSNNKKTRPLSMQSTTSGTYRFEGCDFISNSNQNQVYINPLGGSATLYLTGCNFKTRSIFGLGNKAANILLASSFIWSNMNLTGCSGGFTFEISRASTSLTAEEMEIYRTIKSNNSGSMRFIFTDGEKNNL